MTSLVPVILVGGSGSRLWPLSYGKYTKPFIRFFNQANLAQQTLDRLKDLKIKKILIICNAIHLDEVQSLHSDFKIQIIVEENTCNTAAAGGIASLSVDPSDTILLLPADHLISDAKKFTSTVNHALVHHSDQHFLAFCKDPKSENINYGYLKKGKKLASNLYEVSKFVEKPNKSKAKSYINSKNYLWNCGIYLFQAKTFLKELKSHEPKIYFACMQANERSQTLNEIKFLNVILSKELRLSVDTAIMEKTKFIRAIIHNSDWSDLGTWNSLDQASSIYLDKDKNYISGDVILKSVKKSFVISDRKTFLQGLDNIFVISTQAGLLISNKKDSLDNFQKLIDDYEINNTDTESQNGESLNEEERPWGSFQVLNKGEGFQSKILKILPNEKISLQKHHHRSEHWIVLEGLARITKDDQTFLLQENESTFIPIGSKHSIKNISSKILKIFEVQTGNFLSESDIVRYNDKYGRK